LPERVSVERSIEKLRILSYVCDGRTGARADLSAAIQSGLAEGVDVISGQGNGMDNGPYFLGSGDPGGQPTTANFEAAVLGAREAGIPFVFSLGGRAGADVHLEVYLRVFDEISREHGLGLRTAVISGEIDKAYLRKKLEDGVEMPRLTPTERLAEVLTEQELDEATVVQSQMGPEPLMEALRLFDDELIDGVLTGRALDTGVHMALPLLRGFPIAATAHLAKIIECGSMCCDPPQPFLPVLGEITKVGEITVRPARIDDRCTVRSVASHALYEREDPSHEQMPGGMLDVAQAKYVQLDQRTVGASGAAWEDTPYTVKLEGVRSLGHETAFIVLGADPVLISEIEDFLATSIQDTKRQVVQAGDVDDAERLQIAAHIVGKGCLPIASTAAAPAEIAIIVRVVAPTQQASYRAATTMRIRLQMGDYPGRLTTAGNFAFPLPKVFLDQGEAFAFNIWHLLPLDDPTEPFPIQMVQFPR
jgi:hypothetical protein